jgi:hypothetical protein
MRTLVALSYCSRTCNNHNKRSCTEPKIQNKHIRETDLSQAFKFIMEASDSEKFAPLAAVPQKPCKFVMISVRAHRAPPKKQHRSLANIPVPNKFSAISRLSLRKPNSTLSQQLQSLLARCLIEYGTVAHGTQYQPQAVSGALVSEKRG